MTGDCPVPRDARQSRAEQGHRNPQTATPRQAYQPAIGKVTVASRPPPGRFDSTTSPSCARRPA